LQARDMIAVLVRDQDGGERFGIGFAGGEPFERFPAGKAGVDQQARSLGGNQRGVARAGRRENGNFDDAKLLKMNAADAARGLRAKRFKGLIGRAACVCLREFLKRH
jgi:hypothetical protein